MTKTNTQPTGSKWFLNRSVAGFETGIYYASEVRNFPPKVKKYVQSLSSALANGLLEGDMHSAGDINEIDLYTIPNRRTGELAEIKGTKSGLAPGRSLPTKSERKEATKIASEKKVGNKLRDALQDSAKFSTEDSLKAKIAQAKAKRKR